MIKVTSKYEAWKVVDGYLGETKLDEKASERAGYEIYKNDKAEQERINAKLDKLYEIKYIALRSK